MNLYQFTEHGELSATETEPAARLDPETRIARRLQQLIPGSLMILAPYEAGSEITLILVIDAESQETAELIGLSFIDRALEMIEVSESIEFELANRISRCLPLTVTNNPHVIAVGMASLKQS